MQSYVDGTTAGTYTPETMYTRYGHWLAHDGTDTTVHTYADGPSAVENVYNVGTGENALKDTSATYTGKAAGMSVLTTSSAGKVTGRSSGSFTADAELTMNFGSNPSIGGTIWNFQGSAVDSGWSVDLSHASNENFDGSLEFSQGVTNDDGTTATTNEGNWSATAYGVANKRPTGVYGEFEAFFTNGAVAGAYATRKQ